jgi:hypothetical protein
MPQLTLYIDTSRNQLVGGVSNPGFVNPAQLPFFFGDQIQLVVFLLNNIGPQGLGNSPYTIIPSQGLALQVYLDDGSAEGTVYTQQIEFQADQTGTYFYGTLPLNTAALETLLGSATSAPAYLKIGYFQNGLPTTVYSGQVTINVGMPVGALAVPAGQTPLSAEVAAQTYVPIIGNPGQPIYLTSPAGKKIMLVAQDNPDGTASFQATEIN